MFVKNETSSCKRVIYHNAPRANGMSIVVSCFISVSIRMSCFEFIKVEHISGGKLVMKVFYLGCYPRVPSYHHSQKHVMEDLPMNKAKLQLSRNYVVDEDTVGIRSAKAIKYNWYKETIHVRSMPQAQRS